VYRCINISRCLLLSATIALAVILESPVTCRAAGLGVIVPAYFYPGTGGPGGVGDGWSAMTSAADQVPLTAVLNPNSGPLPGPADPNYIAAMTNLENATGKVVAYVDTGNGGTSLSTVESEISTYISQYGGLINGFFLDDMSVVPSTLSYYQNLESYIKSLSPSYTIVGNPGQPFLNGVSATDYLSTADIFDIFEGPNTGNPGFNTYPYGQTWFQSDPSSRFSNIVYDAPSTSLLANITEAAELNAGDVYITDQTGNPYAQLPSYWDQEVSAIANLPEPSMLTMVFLSGMILLRPIGKKPRIRRRKSH
jgi:hypothetical protein